jgi:hypothetical protein
MVKKQAECGCDGGLHVNICAWWGWWCVRVQSGMQKQAACESQSGMRKAQAACEKPKRHADAKGHDGKRWKHARSSRLCVGIAKFRRSADYEQTIFFRRKKLNIFSFGLLESEDTKLDFLWFLNLPNCILISERKSEFHVECN